MDYTLPDWVEVEKCDLGIRLKATASAVMIVEDDEALSKYTETIMRALRSAITRQVAPEGYEPLFEEGPELVLARIDKGEITGPKRVLC